MKLSTLSQRTFSLLHIHHSFLYLPFPTPTQTPSRSTMATTATSSPINSYFSTAITRHRRLRTNLSVPVTFPLINNNSISLHNVRIGKHWLPKMSAAMTQEEANVVAEPETEPEPEPEAVITQSTKLYFGNLPYNCDSSQLAGIIQEYASPEMVEVLYERDTGRSRGFAFVTMSSVEDCEAVIKNLDGSQYGGRTLRVNFSDKPKPKEPLYPESDFKLFVGNLSWSVTSESLIGIFQEYGNVVGARVLYDGDTGRSRGYGFVCYSTKEEMDAAMESLNGAELEGRAMRISLALGKKS